MKIKNKNLIVGGSGFIGSRLMSILDPHSFINLDKNSSPFFDDVSVKADIRNYNEIKIHKETETVILLAAEHRDDVTPTSLYYDVNVEGTKNVLRAMDEAGVKNIIFTSSVAIYGLNKINPDENHKEDPFNHYGKSKWLAELELKEWFNNNSHEKSVTIVRPTVVFGERNRGNVYNLLKQISTGKFVMIGEGLNKKSMAYVGNIVAFIKDRIEKTEPGYHVYNYVDKPDYNMNELVNVIEEKMKLNIPKIKIPFLLGLLAGFCFDFFSKLSGRKFSISSVRVRKFCATTQFKASKVHSIFKSPYTLEEGLKRTLEHEFINKQEDDILFFTE